VGFALIIGFSELLQNVTTNNYSATANSHTLQLQHALNLLGLLCLHQSLPGDGSQQFPLLPYSRSIPAGDCPTAEIIAPAVLLITSRHGQRRKHRSSVTVSNCCRANMLVSLLSNGCCSFAYLVVVAHQRVYMPLYINIHTVYHYIKFC
jgi:hypothetical protein